MPFHPGSVWQIVSLDERMYWLTLEVLVDFHDNVILKKKFGM
jgi:hypothetical protein